MKKFLTPIFWGLLCFLSGIFTQYVFSVNSFAHEAECEKVPISQPDLEEDESSDSEIKEKEIQAYAEKITVKVFSGENSGSGILIHQQGNDYQVVTNDHVLLFGKQNKSYRVQTPDGKIYPAKVVNQFNFKKYDLGVLQFESKEFYEIVSLSKLSPPNIGEKVYAAGFPYEADTSINRGFKFTDGTVNLMSKLSFRGGYQIGYTNDVQKGMSGGPLFNHKGEIIGINGRHKYPAWGNPYIFEDGTVASPEKKKEMSQYSWAIPIDTFLRFAPELGKANKSNLNKYNNLYGLASKT